MTFRTVAYGTDLDEFENSLTMAEVPHGTKMRLEIDTRPWPVAPLANLWGAEWVADKMLDNGAIIDDVRGSGAYKVIVDMTAQSVLFWIVLAIVAIIGAGFLIHEIRLLVELPGEGAEEVTNWIKWGSIGILGIVALAIIARR